jgi:hypothetical protein
MSCSSSSYGVVARRHGGDGGPVGDAARDALRQPDAILSTSLPDQPLAPRSQYFANERGLRDLLGSILRRHRFRTLACSLSRFVGLAWILRLRKGTKRNFRTCSLQPGKYAIIRHRASRRSARGVLVLQFESGPPSPIQTGWDVLVQRRTPTTVGYGDPLCRQASRDVHKVRWRRIIGASPHLASMLVGGWLRRSGAAESTDWPRSELSLVGERCWSGGRRLTPD